MANSFSIVIVCKNEKGNIERVLKSLHGLSDDIVVYDSGSTDGTPEIVRGLGATVYTGEWMGFGKTKKLATSLAKHNWVLSLDADEAIDDELRESLQNIELKNNYIVYQCRFKNFLGEKHLRWGEWGADKHIRLFNRTVVDWDEAIVHEALVIPASVKTIPLKGYILHQTMKDTVEYGTKMVKYALLNAEKYYAQGKKSSWIKRCISPVFSFIKNYIVQLGFLDGWEGLLSARMTSFYTSLKYARLKELWSEQQKH